MSEDNQPEADSSGAAFRFRWSFIILPVGFLILSLIFSLVYYWGLSDQVAYRFESDGSPSLTASRGVVVFWMLALQLVLTLVAVILTWGITSLAGRYIDPAAAVVKPGKIIMFMGNIIAMPQSIFCFALLDIFIYNSNGIHLMPVWLFALIIMVLVGVILGIFVFRVMRLAWKANKELYSD